MRWFYPWCFALVPLLIALYFVRRGKGFDRPASVGLSTVGWLPARGKDRTRWVLNVIYGLALLLVTLALARPQRGLRENELSGRGVDIMLALDLSSSMRSEDLQPGVNRLAVAKQVAEVFVNQRPHDRMGLVVFAGTAVTQCPLTLNHEALIDLLRRLDFGMVEDGTAIGQGLATALNRLRQSKAKSKVVILLTDGVNNRGAIDPLTAAELARAMGVRVYTIGVGTTGIAPIPVDDPVNGRHYEMQPVEIDEAVLTTIANQTGGRYFRARDSQALAAIYHQIDTMEKSDLTSAAYSEWRDRGPDLLMAAMLLLAIGYALSLTAWARVP